MSDPAIRVQNLSRQYGKLFAVQDLSFEIPRGDVVGFVGANGAGKTTTMRVLATLDYPSAGTCEVLGHNVVLEPEKVRHKIGWMPDDLGNFENVTVIEFLDFYARAMGFKGKERRERIEEVMDFTELHPLADRLSDKLSKGQTQRLGLARALIHDPEILIMDEPAAGLDPKARVELKRLIRVLADDGKTVFISSHILSELGEMCDNLLFINGGKAVHYGSAEELQHGGDASGSAVYRVHVHGDPQAVGAWAEMNPYVEFSESLKLGGRIKIESADPEVAADVLARMINSGLKITEFHREQRNLEDAFIDILSQGTPHTTPPPIPIAPPAPNP